MTDLPLSPRERQLLRRIAVEIARQIGGKAAQILEQRIRLLIKLGISTPAEIADAAEQLASFKTYRA